MATKGLTKRQTETLKAIYEAAATGPLPLSLAIKGLNTIFKSSLSEKDRSEAAQQIVLRVGKDDQVKAAMAFLDHVRTSGFALETATDAIKRTLPQNQWIKALLEIRDAIGDDSEQQDKILKTLTKIIDEIPEEDRFAAAVEIYKSTHGNFIPFRHDHIDLAFLTAYRSLQTTTDDQFERTLATWEMSQESSEYTVAKSVEQSMTALFDELLPEDGYQRILKAFYNCPNKQNELLDRALKFMHDLPAEKMFLAAKEMHSAARSSRTYSEQFMREVEKWMIGHIRAMPATDRYANAMEIYKIVKDPSMQMEAIQKASEAISHLPVEEQYKAAYALDTLAVQKMAEYERDAQSRHLSSFSLQSNHNYISAKKHREDTFNLVIEKIPTLPEEDRYNTAMRLTVVGNTVQKNALLQIALDSIDGLKPKERIAAVRAILDFPHASHAVVEMAGEVLKTLQVKEPITTIDGFIGQMRALPTFDPS